MSERVKYTLLWSGLALAVIMGMVWQFFPLKDAEKRLQSLPRHGPAFAGRAVPMTDWEKDFFADVNVMKRVYRVGDQDLFITALDGTKNRHLVHDPLYCFRGSGWQVVSQRTVKFPGSGTAALLELEKEGERQQAMYWFSNGKTQFDAPIKYWWEATLRRLTLGASGEEPVLIVVQPASGAKKLNWKQLVRYFPQLVTL